jgi:acyl-CoA thioesterase
MAEFFYMNINFQEKKRSVEHMNKIPYRLEA